MPHTGILAANPDGAAQCFLRYCRAGAEQLGSHTYPDVTLDYIGFGHTLSAWQRGDLATVGGNLARSVARLAAAGAEFFVCPDNTVHLVLDEIDSLALPGLHIVEVVAQEARSAGYRKVGILGTRFVVDSPLYPTWLNAAGIAVDTPGPEDEDRLNSIIFDELVDGVVTTESRAWCVDLVRGFADRGCDAVALVSTELALVLTQADSPIPVVDSTRAAADRALAVALGNQPLPTWRGGPSGQPQVSGRRASAR